MDDPPLRWFGATSFGVLRFGVLCTVVAMACAGSETPQIDDEFEQAIADTYGNGSTAAAGSAAGPAGGAGGGSFGGSGGALAAGGSANAGAAGSSDGACDAFGILEASCSGAACHGAGARNGNFAENEDIAAAFADQEPVTAACSMDGPVLSPANPRSSLLIQKVNGTVPCGSPMPLVGALSDAEITCLEEWIRSL